MTNLDPHQEDPIEQALKEIRQMLNFGVDRFHLPRAVMIDLFDQADRLEELFTFKVEYGVNALLNFLPNDGARERLLEETLGATPNSDGIYELPRDSYTGCFWREGDGWSWFIRFPDGTCR